MRWCVLGLSLAAIRACFSSSQMEQDAGKAVVTESKADVRGCRFVARVTATVDLGTSGQTITNEAQVLSAPETDVDSTPGNGILAEDDPGVRLVVEAMLEEGRERSRILMSVNDLLEVLAESHDLDAVLSEALRAIRLCTHEESSGTVAAVTTYLPARRAARCKSFGSKCRYLAVQ